MERIWIFFTIVLDVFPYIFLQYLPFKKQLKFGYFKTIGICTAVVMPWFLSFAFLSDQPFFTDYVMTFWRVSLLIPLFLLAVILVKDNIWKNAFVFAFMLPYVLVVLTAASFINTHIGSSNFSPYMVSSIARTIIVLISFPFVVWLFQSQLIPAMTLQDGGIWKYAWPIPVCYNAIAVFFINPAFQTSGATLRSVLGHLFIMICCILTCLLVVAVLRRTQERAELLEHERHSRQLLDLQAQQYRSIAKNIEETARSRHDLRHQILLIQSFITAGNINELRLYLDEYASALSLESGTSILTVSKNYTINAILGHYLTKAEQEGIQVELDLNLDELTNIADSDLCVLYGNLLENAIEACHTILDNRKIRVESEVIARRFSIVVVNTFDGISHIKNGCYLSRKREFQKEGVGLATVKAVVNKYGGKLRFCEEKNHFKISLYLQLDYKGEAFLP